MDLREVVEFLKDFIIYFIIVIIVFLVFVFIFSFQRIAGNSMEPTYSNNDIAVLSKIHKTIFGVEKNDIIAFSTSSGETFIKRVIAAIIIFFLPYLLNFLLEFIDGMGEVCVGARVLL